MLALPVMVSHISPSCDGVPCHLFLVMVSRVIFSGDGVPCHLFGDGVPCQPV